MKKTAFIADDHELIIEGARSKIENIENPPMEVIGSTTDSSQVFRRVSELKPDILLLDVGFPSSPCGITLLKQVTEETGVDVIISTRYNNYPYFWKAIAEGAKAFHPKDSDEEVFVKAVRTVAKGGKYIPEDLIRGEQFDEKMDRLSSRQLEWARHFAQGLDPKETADLMNVERNTIYKFKTRVQDRLMIDSEASLREMLGHYFDVAEWAKE